jgi:hypothetical protein
MSRAVIARLARVFEDTLNFVPYAHVTTYSEKVGINTAMDIAAEVSRAGTYTRGAENHAAAAAAPDPRESATKKIPIMPVSSDAAQSACH